MSDKTRVLAQLRRGPVTPVDFQAPAVDGGKPILRVAARIGELRAEGHDITTVATKPVAKYVLKTDAEAQPKPIGFAEALAALDVPAASPYDIDEPWAA